LYFSIYFKAIFTSLKQQLNLIDNVLFVCLFDSLNFYIYIYGRLNLVKKKIVTGKGKNGRPKFMLWILKLTPHLIHVNFLIEEKNIQEIML
jgi:hypothetical protein